MSGGEIIKIGALESVEVVREKQAVRLVFRVGGVPMLQKHIEPAIARRLGDALGFASNDIARGRPLASEADSTAKATEQNVGGRRHGE